MVFAHVNARARLMEVVIWPSVFDDIAENFVKHDLKLPQDFDRYSSICTGSDHGLGDFGQIGHFIADGKSYR